MYGQCTKNSDIGNHDFYFKQIQGKTRNRGHWTRNRGNLLSKELTFVLIMVRISSNFVFVSIFFCVQTSINQHFNLNRMGTRILFWLQFRMISVIQVATKICNQWHYSNMKSWRPLTSENFTAFVKIWHNNSFCEFVALFWSYCCQVGTGDTCLVQAEGFHKLRAAEGCIRQFEC